VAINCAAFADSLLDAELFGATRGAYTGADRDRPGLFRVARGGTLFLDEVGDMPAPMQAKMLRVLEDRRARAVGATTDYPVDVRVVSATHRNLRNDSRTGFRPDLYYRLAVLQIRVRPLRERVAELPSMIEALTPRLLRETGILPRFHPDTIVRLARHDWPGNVRELHAVLARATLRAGAEIVRPEHLDLLPAGDVDEHSGLEVRMIQQALQTTGGSVTEAAQRIGWTRQKLYRRLAALGLS
jgi:two-component system response regulator PilR (NtrC family)